uniref:CCHC-type domain-containing protein n=1 Tax=Amphimedon queenslandica TaxID=400682 RepID=A0A1X7UFM7_AMPQE
MAAPTKHSETASCVVCEILWLRENSCLGRINLNSSHGCRRVTLETVATGVKDLGRENVYYNQQSEQKCYRCGHDGHRSVECQFRGDIFRKCGKKGHLQAVCRSQESNNAAPLEHRRKTTPKAPVRKVDEPEDESSANGDEDEEVPGCFKVKVNSVKATPPPIKVSVKLYGKLIEMEVDTGAAVSIISERTYRKWLKDTPLCPAEIQLQTYTSSH